VTTDREPSSEALGAALIALERFPWRWWQFRLRRTTWQRSELAHAVAAVVEQATRGLCAREIETLDRPGWSGALTTAAALLTFGEHPDLPPFSRGNVPCSKCGEANRAPTVEFRPAWSGGGFTADPGHPEHVVRACRTCGHSWLEQCADAATEPAETEAAL